MIAGPRVCVSPPPKELAVDIARSNDNKKSIAQGNTDNNNNKYAIDDDNNNKTKRHEPYRSPYELRPGDKCRTQLNIVNDDGDLVIISTSPPRESETTPTITIKNNNDDEDDGQYSMIIARGALAGGAMGPAGSRSCTKSGAVPPTGVGLTGWGASTMMTPDPPPHQASCI